MYIYIYILYHSIVKYIIVCSRCEGYEANARSEDDTESEDGKGTAANIDVPNHNNNNNNTNHNTNTTNNNKTSNNNKNQNIQSCLICGLIRTCRGTSPGAGQRQASPDRGSGPFYHVVLVLLYYIIVFCVIFQYTITLSYHTTSH